MHVGGSGISRLGRALAGGRRQREQIKAQKLAESNAFPYPRTELGELRRLVAGRIPDVPGVRARHPPRAHRPRTEQTDGPSPGVSRPSSGAGSPSVQGSRSPGGDVGSVPSPRTCRAPPPSEPEDFAAQARTGCAAGSPCHLPLADKTAFLSIGWEQKRAPRLKMSKHRNISGWLELK